MFTKEIIKEVFAKNNGVNFFINTNEGVGHGINGVSFNSYAGYREIHKTEYGREYVYKEYTNILEVNDNYLVIEYKDDKAWINTPQLIIIPYDSITSIRFLKIGCGDYPSDIEKNPLFE